MTRCTAVKAFAATFTAVVGVLCWSVSAFCQVQVNQNFLPQGPSPATGTLNLIGSTDNFPNGTASGAIEAIVTDPTNANLYYIGTPNGGIWKTTNGGTNWTALTDNQASLSIASLTLDPTDATHNTILAGTGLVSSGFLSTGGTNSFTSQGGLRYGLLYSTNGGTSWTTLGTSAFGGQTVDAVAARGNVLLAGTFEIGFGGNRNTGGLYRSTDGGATFSLVSGTSGLPAGPVTSIVGDPSQSATLYAAVTGATATGAGNASTAVYKSTDSGATWTAVFTSASSAAITTTSQTIIRLATGPNGSVAVGIQNLSTGTLTGLNLSQNAGTTWSALSVPATNPGGQGPLHFAIAIDPANSGIVYVSGDNNFPNNGGFNAVAAFRVSGNTITNLTDVNTGPVNTGNGSTVHPDSRALVFDANGRLLIGTDGGIYARTLPQSTSGIWQGLNGDLQVLETYRVAYDANSKRIVASAQDNGSGLQSGTNNRTFNQVGSGDGINAAVNDRTLTGAGQSAIYTSCQNLSCRQRIIVNSQGTIVSPNTSPFIAGVPVNFNIAVNTPNFFSPFVLNNIDPTKIAVGGQNLYVTQDLLTGANDVNATSVNLTLTDVGATGGFNIRRLAYGTRDNPDVVLAGTNDTMGLFLSATSAANSLVHLPAYTLSGGLAPTGIVFDPRSQNRFYAADNSQLFGTQNQGTTFTNLTAALPANFIRPNAVEFISNNGVNALLVSGLNNVSNASSTMTVADSDALGNLTNWRRFGQGLPNTQIGSLSYNPTVDVLAVGTYGRGAFALYDVTSYFSQANVLQFGLANNDSVPDASFLTDGTVGTRPLVKYGTGTLTINGASSYTGTTSVLGGTMVAGAASVFAPTSAFTVSAGAALNLNNFNQTIGSLAGNGAVTLGSAVLTAGGDGTSTTFGGVLSGAGGGLTKMGSGTLTLTNLNTFTGLTNVNAGVLNLAGGGSLAGPTAVNNGLLIGTGSVSNLGVNGGTFAPGNGTPGTSMTVNGSLVFQSAALFLVQINPTTSSFASVFGTATLNGATVNAFYANGSYVPKQYTILSAAGGVTGTFNSLVNVNLPSSFKASLSTDPTHAFLNLALDFTPGPSSPSFGSGLNSNQQGVANALTNFFNTAGGIPLVYGTLTPAGLTQASGETATGSQQTTFGAMTQFLGVLTDFFIDGRGSNSPPASGAPAFAEDDQANAYAASRKRTAAERDAYAVFTKAPLAKSYDPRWSVWAAGFGGSQTTDGNPVFGSNSTTSRIFGTAVGADVLLSPRTIAGFALAGGGTNFNVNGFGSGRSDLFQAGAFVRHNVGPAYISGALAYGWQDITTDRTLTIAGVDRLRAQFNANAFSGRIEGGYRFVTPWTGGIGITPYAAVQFTTFDLPAYAEQVLSGANTFALAYGSRSVTDARSELGIRADKSFAMPNSVLTLRGRFAWAHDYNPDRSVAATFQALPGASFVVGGASQAPDAALTTASAEIKWLNGWSAAGTFEGEFSQVTSSYAGKGMVRYAW